jgi:uncharacterized Zn finger protein
VIDPSKYWKQPGDGAETPPPVVLLESADREPTPGPARFSEPFIGMFEALRVGPALARGRRDARAGHVRQLTISSSIVTALVRGPEDEVARRARIAVRAFGAAEWARVEDDLAAQARYVADLLAGRMPAGIERVFAGAGLSLLPLSLDEIAMDCGCEHRPLPCAHLAATIHTLAASFDADPFGIFAWRGRGRDELLMRLRQLRGTAAVDATTPAEPQADAGLGDLAAFWGTAPPPPARSTAPNVVARPDGLLDEYDAPPLPAHGQPLVEVLRPAYLALPVREHLGTGPAGAG